jgi:hypothetical protein
MTFPLSEPFWVDLSLINPIEADVTLTDFTVIAESLVNGLPIAEIVTIETIGTLSLRPKEHATVLYIYQLRIMRFIVIPRSRSE